MEYNISSVFMPQNHPFSKIYQPEAAEKNAKSLDIATRAKSFVDIYCLLFLMFAFEKMKEKPF